MATFTPLTTEIGEKNAIIVGAGPVGLFTALKLAQSGISVVVLEKEACLGDSPRATGYYGAALVALHRANILEQAVNVGFASTGVCWRKPLENDGQGGKGFGDVVARLPFQHGDRNSILGRTPWLSLPQSKFVKLLLDEAEASGLVRTYFNMELTAIDDDFSMCGSS